jgi:glycosyltransferase involved in cell wall biosynthesis
MNSKKIRVVHLTSAHPRYDARVFLKECCSLALNGFAVTLVVADGRGSEICKGVEIIDVGQSSGRLARMIVSTRRVYLKALELDADVYHIHDPELLPIGLKLKRRGKIVLFDAHEDIPKQILNKHYLQPWVRSIMSWCFARFERFACAHLDGVVTATPYIRDKFLAINRRSVDINNYPILGELENTVVWSDKSQEVCYVGNVALIRGIKELVQAMALTASSARLNLVGGFDEDGVKLEVASYPGWIRVSAIGVVGRQAVKEVLGRSVAGLVTLHPTPNYLDSLPVKMFEYMSAGIPVIASDFDLWKTIVDKNKCGLCVDPMNPQAIARAIDYLVDNPLEAERMGSNGKKAIHSTYNWSIEEKKLVNFYNLLSTA